MAGAARARSGYAAAVSALERAAALSEDRPSRARRLYAAAGDAHLAGQSGRARELLIAADGLAEDAELRMAVAAVRSRVEAFTGHPALAHRILRQAAHAIQDTDPQRCAELLADSAMAALLAGEAAAAVEDAERAEHLVSDQTGNISLVTKLFQGLILLHIGQLPEGAHRLAESAAMARRTTGDRPPVDYIIAAGLGMTWIGEHIAAREMLAPVVQELREAGALGMLQFALCVVSRAETLAGNLGEARSTAAEAVELSRLTGDEFFCYLALSGLAHVQAIRGAEESCRANVAEALALRREGTDYPRDAPEALGLLELGLAHYDEAIAHFRAGIHAPAAAGAEESHPDLLEAYIRSGRSPTDQAALIDELTQERQFPLQAAVAWRLRGLVADETEFARCFDTALDLHARVDCPFETGRTLLAFGERLRRAGQRIQARQQLHLALDIFDRLQAGPWADRTRNELTATGEAARRRTGASALDELTPQEYQVAGAVAEGGTNREVASALFLSAKTVEFHLGNVYRKLSVRSRTELAHRFPELSQQ
jgi:ATP/maltotriose-dependent transcriptional regulator MalT